MIDIIHLTKLYGSHMAVSDLNVSIKSGQIYGFLGPNGAGKSTTMNIITGCLAATEGQVLIDGHDIFEEPEEAKKLIGYLPEQPPLYLEMTPYEYLLFVAKAKGVKKEDINTQLEYVINVTQINEVKTRLIKHLSKGYRQRVGIAQALLGKPQVIILDEPTVGLDPLQIIEIRDLIKELGKTHTVILSSHILSEVRAVCDSIMIISEGKLVASDTPDNLEKLFAGSYTLKLTVKATKDEVLKALESIENINNVEYIPSENSETAEVVIESGTTEDISENVFFGFCNIKRPILRMSLAKASLEEVFLELTGNKEQEETFAKEISGENTGLQEASEEIKEEKEEVDEDESNI
ncbi:MAG: ABC transporter ATP-binding protein [Lachnospiraceae bacterium]|nr:ABC transporter ATP-binding protein [Lachnospiraceae bacterium]